MFCAGDSNIEEFPLIIKRTLIFVFVFRKCAAQHMIVLLPAQRTRGKLIFRKFRQKNRVKFQPFCLVNRHDLHGIIVGGLLLKADVPIFLCRSFRKKFQQHIDAR